MRGKKFYKVVFFTLLIYVVIYNGFLFINNKYGVDRSNIPEFRDLFKSFSKDMSIASFLYNWNPDIVPSLFERVINFFHISSIKDFVNTVFNIGVLVVKYVFRQPL